MLYAYAGRYNNTGNSNKCPPPGGILSSRSVILLSVNGTCYVIGYARVKTGLSLSPVHIFRFN